MEIKNRGHTAYYLRISGLYAFVSSKDIKIKYGEKDLQLDGGIARSIGFIASTEQLLRRFDVLRQMRDNGVRLINDPDAILVARDKYQSIMELKKTGVPVPETAVVEDPFDAMKLVSNWGEAVIKPLIGSMGLGAVKVSDPDIAFRIAKTILATNQPVYIQKYVKKPNRDIRIFVVGEQIIGGMYRISNSSWKTNIAQGALAQVLVPNQELQEIAIKATKALKLEYAGVDIAEDEEGGYKIFEVNASPLWKGLMEATGINPAKYIVDHLIKLVRR